MARPACGTLPLVLIVAVACGRQTPPTAPDPQLAIACPANIAIDGATGPGQTVTWPAPIVGGARAPFEVQCQPASGSTFPLGTTMVSCAVTDGLGRSTSCAFDVTLAARLLGVSRVLAFGDSVTAGHDGTEEYLTPRAAMPELSYPTALRKLIAEAFPDEAVSVVNAGLSSERASCENAPPDECGVERLPDVLDQVPSDVVILLDGYNDLLNDQDVLEDGRSVAIDHVVDAVREMVRTSRAAGARIVMVGTITAGRPHLPPARDRQIRDDVLRETNAGLAAMAAAEGAILVDAYAAFLGHEAMLVTDDGLHPTELGYGVLGELFYQALLDATADLARAGGAAARVRPAGSSMPGSSQ